jgi:dipeptidyl aminopeptidase/acylaminoacyl peptidase
MRLPLPTLSIAALALAGLSNAATPARPRPAAAPADTTWPVRLEHVLTLATPGGITWSADGTRLAFVENAPDTAEDTNNQDIWYVDLKRGPEALRLTRHPKADISPTFSPGGDTIAFVGTRGTGDDAKAAIHMMSLRGGEPWAFGAYDEAVSEVAWSPDGRSLAYVKLDTLPKSVREWKKKKWDQAIEDEKVQYTRVWVVDIASGKQRPVVTAPLQCWSVKWAPDSKRLACLVNPTGFVDDENATDIAVVTLDTGELTTLGVLGGPFAWAPDSRTIAFASGGDRAKWVQKSDLWSISAHGGTPVNLTASFDEDATAPVWSPDGETLFFLSAQGVTTRLANVPANGGTVRLGRDFKAEAGGLATNGRGYIAWTQSSPDEPGEVWFADEPEAAAQRLSSVNAAIARATMGTTRAVQWTSTDGVRVEGVLLRPAGAPANAPLKTLVLLHGGPYTARYALGFQSGPQYFAAHGWQVFMPNFRSSGGYGTAFMLRQRADWGGQDWRDVMSGVDSLVARGLVDSTRMAVYGGSYGGYLSAWAITQTRRFSSACVFAGAVELASFYGQSDTHRYRAYEFEGTPWQSRDKWAQSSPFTYIDRARTPTLILVGENDPRVPLPQAQQLYTALLVQGVPTEYVHYPREGHGLREPRHRADQFLRQLAWFEKWAAPGKAAR